jgi:hypothetical protein
MTRTLRWSFSPAIRRQMQTFRYSRSLLHRHGFLGAATAQPLRGRGWLGSCFCQTGVRWSQWTSRPARRRCPRRETRVAGGASAAGGVPRRVLWQRAVRYLAHRHLRGCAGRHDLGRPSVAAAEVDGGRLTEYPSRAGQYGRVRVTVDGPGLLRRTHGVGCSAGRNSLSCGVGRSELNAALTRDGSGKP